MAELARHSGAGGGHGHIVLHISSPPQMWCKVWGVPPLAVPHSPPLHPNACCNGAGTRVSPRPCSRVSPNHPGHLEWTPSPGTERDRTPGCTHTCVRTHTRVQEGCQAVHRRCRDTHPHKPIGAHTQAEDTYQDPSHSPHVPQRCQRVGLNPVPPKTTSQGPAGTGGGRI